MLNFLKVHAVKKKLEEVEAYLDKVLDFDHPEMRAYALRTLHAGGKRVRPSLTILTASMFKNEDNIVPLAAAMELLHMASLIHDDVVDEADTRRGQATINVLKNNRYAIHVGDYILAEAIDIISKQPNADRLLAIMGDLSAEMSLGEVEQLRSTYDVHQTVADYNYRIDRKTALLMATSCQAAAVASGASEDEINRFYQIGYNLGMDFQIKDDLLDMTLDSEKLGKPAGSDLARGIMTLPTILVLEKSFAERDELINLIENRFPNGQADVDRAIAIVLAQNGISDAEVYAEQYLKQAEADIAALPDYPMKKVLLEGVDYLRERAF
ncbi:MAG: polyprenyl synthetase family protein [Peptococcaceae bacterium]|nr:polyprenyl synthetase family protein [Peptococcaceae bacterium]MBQ6853104.1 polyprenyl synthetase family protein [Peptococcaceae bacterium]MBQ7024976.1 polyprenyl synthetase family protein [Peptococcaceae bacterium]